MTVKFEKDGLFEYKWNGDKRKYVRRRVKKIAVWKHLRDACEIAEGVTLLDIFRTVDQYKMLKLFISQYSWCRSIDDFHAQAEEPYSPDEDEEKNGDPMTALEVYWACDLGDHYEDESRKAFDLTPSFHAIGLVGPNCVKNFGYGEDQIGEKMQWGIGFTPMQEIAHLPVVLNQTASFYDSDEYLAALKAYNKTDRTGPKPEPRPVMVAERTYNLQDVLDAIYWEISFHGGPAQKNEVKDMLKERVDEIKSGLADSIPAEEVFPELKETAEENKGMKIMLHPDVAKQFGFDVDAQKETD